MAETRGCGTSARRVSTLRRTLLRAMPVLPAAWAGATLAASAADELKLSVAIGPSLPLGHAAERWAERLREPGVGAVLAKLHPGAILAQRDPARELGALKDGALDLAVGSALQWSLQTPALGVFALPWLAPEDAQLTALAADPALRELLQVRLAAAGAQLVALAPLGYREIATTTRAIRTPEDCAGLRLRAIASPMLQDILRALGAAPQTLPFAQAQAAIAQGQLDGQEGTPTSLAAARITANGQRHVTDLGGVGDAMVFAVRASVWSAWATAQRERVTMAATAAIGDARALEREQAALRHLATQGASVLRLTAAGQRAFKHAVREVDARWRETVGGDIVAAAERVLTAAPALPTPR